MNNPTVLDREGREIVVGGGARAARDYSDSLTVLAIEQAAPSLIVVTTQHPASRTQERWWAARRGPTYTCPDLLVIDDRKDR